jgi:phosphatidylserine decarboxylase
MIKRYIKKNNINMDLFLEENYKSFNEFFTRKIKPENRPFSLKSDHFISPCDGKLSIYRINETSRYNIKGYIYTVEELLKNKDLADRYIDGYCVVIRLSVEDYHRYFYVDNCRKENNVFIQGKLHTVQPYALEKRKVFSENCREYTIMHTENFGVVTQVEVGAMMVGRISNNHQCGTYNRGEEKGKFEFGGSTIVLLIEKDKVIFDEEFFVNTDKDDETYVLCGERIGYSKKEI